MIKEEKREAIEYLKKYRELDKQLYQTAPFISVAHNALVKCLRHWDTAIQALSQDLCEDTISRKAVIDQMYEWMNSCEYRKVNATDYFVNRINKLPFVTPSNNGWEEMTVPCENCGHDMTFKIAVCGEPSRRKGHWIDEGQYAEGHSHHAYRCSECGQHIIEFPSRLMDENPYCKYCGAEMENNENE